MAGTDKGMVKVVAFGKDKYVILKVKDPDKFKPDALIGDVIIKPATPEVAAQSDLGAVPACQLCCDGLCCDGACGCDGLCELDF